MKFLSFILIFLACFGFTVKLADKFSGTELMVKEYHEADDKGDQEKKEKEYKEKIVLRFDGSFTLLSFTLFEACDQKSFSEGFVSSPYNPPDLL